MCAFVLHASEAEYDFEAEGVRYTVLSALDLTAEVVGFSDTFNYNGILDIPADVEFRGRTLAVLGIAQNAFTDITDSEISFNIGNLSYVREQPDTKTYKVYADRLEQFTGGLCYPIASNCWKEYYVNGKPLEEISLIASNKVEFIGVRTLKKINLKDNELKNIPSFGSCINVEDVCLPDGAQLPDGAFMHCAKLNRVYVTGNGLYKAGDFAFFGCTSLKKIDGWFDSYTLMQHTFDCCPALESLNLSKNVRYFRGFHTLVWESPQNPKVSKYFDPFSGTNNIREVNIQSLESWMNIDTRYDSNMDFFAPYFIRSGHSIQGLENIALKLNGENLDEINIDWNITTIKNNTFRGVNNLKSVVVGPSVKAIGDEAFYNCSNLTKVELSDSINNISYRAFAFSPIDHIDIPKAVESIGNDAFTHVRSIDFWCPLKDWSYDCIGQRTQEIGFHNTANSGRFTSSGLKRVRVEAESGGFYFNKGAFANCPNLEELIIEKMQTPYCFEENCFANTALKSLVLPSWPTICSGAFRNCTKLESVTFSGSSNIMAHSSGTYTWNGTSYSGVAPFYNCTNLNTISFARNLNITHWYSYQGEWGGRKWYELSGARLSPWYNCPISKIVISGYELDVDYHMNLEYPLKHLVLGEQTEWIHFTGTSSGKESRDGYNGWRSYSYEYGIDPQIVIESHNPIPPTIDGSLPTNIYLNATVLVPYQSVELYRESPSWKPFWNIKENAAGIDEIAADNPQITIEDGVVKISNKAPETIVRIFSIQGTKIVESTDNIIFNLEKGLYIVQIGDKSLKVKI